MKFLVAVFLLAISTNLFAGPIMDGIEAENIKKGLFGIEGNQTTVSPTSPCAVALNEETNISTGPESKTDDYISTKLLYHGAFEKCMEKAVKFDIAFVSVEQEEKFCYDDASFDADMIDTIAKMKVAKSPTTGKYAGVNIAIYIPALVLLQAARPTSCARYTARHR